MSKISTKPSATTSGGKNKLSRKQLRKSERKLKKARKLAFSKRISVKTAGELSVKETPATPEPKQRSVAKKAKTKPIEKKRDSQLDNRKEERKQLRRAIKRDEDEIKYYRKMLGYKKRKNDSTPTIFATEGLDYLLDVCDAEKRKAIAETGDMFDGAQDSDGEHDADDNYNSSGDEAPEEYPTVSKRVRVEKHDISGSEAATEVPVGSDGGVESDAGSADASDEGVSMAAAEEEERQDIYGRSIDHKGRPIDRNPAGARQKLVELEAQSSSASTLSGDRVKLTKQMRGLINKLSESTLVSTWKQMKDVHQGEYSRNDVKHVFSETILSLISTPFNVPDRLAIEIVVLISLLHSDGFIDISSHFLETLVIRCNALRLEEQLDKTLRNCTTILTHLLNFKVIKASLVIDWLRTLLSGFTEKDIELIITIFTYCGLALRKQEGSALKVFVNDVQLKIDNRDAISKFENRSRVQFMFDTIMAIKNGNAAKISHHFDISLLEHYKKLLLGIRKGGKEAPLPMGLDDLLNAETHGRWWVIGSAWSAEVAAADGESVNVTDAAANDQLGKFPAPLLKLAKRARMNTDLRRLIFCTVMTSEDCMDCFEKLNRLDLKGQREREVLHILVQCCIQEKQFNQFYGLVLSKFCSLHQRFQLTAQYALWDRLKQLATLERQSLSNLSQLLVQLLKCEAIGLSVLKVIDFARLERVQSKLLQNVLTSMFTSFDRDLLARIFQKALINVNLRSFVDGLQIFLHRFMRKKDDFDATTQQQKISDVFDWLDTIWND